MSSRGYEISLRVFNWTIVAQLVKVVVDPLMIREKISFGGGGCHKSVLDREQLCLGVVSREGFTKKTHT